MWCISNRTAYAADRNWTRDEAGVHWYLVAIRATFDIDTRGVLALADEQTPPVLGPEYFDEPGTSSLEQDSDLLEFKPGTDVLVHGSAVSPNGRPAPEVMVSLKLGALQKDLVVFGRRVYYEAAGLRTTAPQPFVEQPIRYEYAFGGSDVSAPDPAQWILDERNPVGRGYTKNNRPNLQSTPAHQIEYASGSPDGAGPAGFGPIDRGWLPRRPLAGTYDANWVETQKPLLAKDYDLRFGHAAPVDQQLSTPLAGGERLALRNMTPEGMLVVEVPRIQLRLESRFGSKDEEHGAHLSTLAVDTNARTLSVTYQSRLRVRARDVDYLDETTIEEVRS